jgi:hypothetical protein
MRQTLVDALAAGPPYLVMAAMHNVPAGAQMQILTELMHRGLITSGPSPVLTEAGIAEAKWFTEPVTQDKNKDSDDEDQDEGSGNSL